MVATMNEALEKLQVASNSGDLAALQDSLNFELQKNPQELDVLKLPSFTHFHISSRIFEGEPSCCTAIGTSGSRRLHPKC